MEANTGPVQAHHERTAHRPDRLSGAGRLDWSNRPRPDKRYRGVEPVPLPAEWQESELPAGAVLSGDVSLTGPNPDLAELARLLFFADGVVRRRRLESLTLHFRAAPSAGALYPVEVYVVARDLDGLPAGVYHFEPITFSLQPLRAGDWRACLGEAAADPQLSAAPLTVALTGVPWRTLWKYAERGYRHLFWDAGAIAANLLASAAAKGLPARLVTGFVDQAVADLLAVAPGQAPAEGGETPLALLPVGTPGDPPPRAADPPSLEHLEVEPLSRHVRDEPGLWEAHHAGDFDEPEAVTAWRTRISEAATATGAPVAPSPGAPVASGPDGADPLEEIILRRGSTRRFAHETVPRRTLEWPLTVAARDIPGDFAAPGHTHLQHLVVVHAVEGVAGGAYRCSHGRLAALHAHASRRRTTELCLDQPLGGDAASVVFLTVDLDTVVAAAGNRAYRVAQLAAGVAAERLQLAAFAADAGATGLTFFDHEVRTFFGTPAWPMLAVAVGVPAYRARPGRRPEPHPQ